MFFLPFERLTINTSMSPKEVKERLDYAIDYPQWFRNPDELDKPFEGILKENYFKIKRIIFYKNLVLPIIQGRIYPNNSGCCLKILIRWHHLETLVFILWIIFTVKLFSPGVQAAIENRKLTQEAIFLIFWIAIVYIIGLIEFKIETYKAKKLFLKILDKDK